MKKQLLLLVVTGFAFAGYSQTATVLHTETFEAGGSGVTLNTTDMSGIAAGENPWVLNNAYAGGSGTFMCMSFAIPFTVPAAATQPAGITNNPTSTYLHVTPHFAIPTGGSVPAASYVTADGVCNFGAHSTFTRMNTDVSTIGQDSVTLDLWWMCGGSTAYYGEVYYSTDGGLSWLTVTNPLNGTNQWRGQTNWVNSIVHDANWDGQAALRFGFRFVAGPAATGSDLDPGFAIDDIEITGYTTESCTETTSTINPTVCNSYTSPSGNYTWTVSNTYMDTIPNTEGCDSVITVNLTINTADNGVMQTGSTLSADAAGAVYQWLDCNNAYAVIAGASGQDYTPTSNGSYAVSVTENGCTDTSACITISDLGFEEGFQNRVRLYPNPTSGNVTLRLDQVNAEVRVTIYTADGRLVSEAAIVNQAVTELELGEDAGVYLLYISTPEERTIMRVIRE